MKLAFTTVNVKNVGHCLECKKGDAYRKSDVGLREQNVASKEFQKGIYIVNRKIQILKDKEKQQIEANAQNQNKLCRFLFFRPSERGNCQRHEIVYDDRQNHQANKDRLPISVEKQRSNQQKCVFEPSVQQVIPR